MVGVVGSSPIAPTKIGSGIKHLAETLGAFFLPVRNRQEHAGFRLRHVADPARLVRNASFGVTQAVSPSSHSPGRTGSSAMQRTREGPLVERPQQRLRSSGGGPLGFHFPGCADVGQPVPALPRRRSGFKRPPQCARRAPGTAIGALTSADGVIAHASGALGRCGPSASAAPASSCCTNAAISPSVNPAALRASTLNGPLNRGARWTRARRA